MHRSRYEKLYKNDSLPTSVPGGEAVHVARGSKWNFCFLFVIMILLCFGMGQMFLFYHVSQSSSGDLQQKLDECTSLLKSYTKDTSESSYDLRDVLLLPSSTSHEMTLQAFQSRWQVRSDLYQACGVTTNRSPPAVAKSASICDYVIISSWAPRPCGIATHSGMLYEALRRVCPLKSRIDVIAVTTSPQALVAPVVSFIHTEEDYASAAAFISKQRYGTVILAYEFGLYADEAVLCLLRLITSSRIVTIFHTVADNLPLQKQALTEQVLLLSHRSIVMTETMKRTMQRLHQPPDNLLAVIPHGVPRQDTWQPHTDIPVIISNGLLHQGKGIEDILRALPLVITQYPQVQYHILGTPHPTGDGTAEYYEMLLRLVTDLKIHRNVVFNNTFLSEPDLLHRLESASIYVNAYRDRTASVSGTLAMAMGVGIPCISTPYPFAEEMLANGAGVLVPFESSTSVARAILYLLDNPHKAKEISRRAVAKTMTWNQVAWKVAYIFA